MKSVKPSLVSFGLHAALAAALYWSPTFIHRPFESSGSREAITLELLPQDAVAGVEIEASLPNPTEVVRDPEETMETALQPRSVELVERQVASPVQPPKFPDVEVRLHSHTVALAAAPVAPADEAELTPLQLTPRQVTPPRELVPPLPLAQVPVPKLQSVGLADKAADFSNNVPPRYPEIAYRNRWEGTVTLRLSVDHRGSVIAVEIVSSSGHVSLDQAAVEAVSRWRGSPATRDGQAAASIEVLPIRFRL